MHELTILKGKIDIKTEFFKFHTPFASLHETPVLSEF